MKVDDWNEGSGDDGWRPEDSQGQDGGENESWRGDKHPAGDSWKESADRGEEDYEYDSRPFCGCDSCGPCLARKRAAAYSRKKKKNEKESSDIFVLRSAVQSHRLGEITDEELVNLVYELFEIEP